MEGFDLSLVPIDEMLKECEKRCICFICAYDHIENEKKQSMFLYGNGTWFDGVKLASILNNDILNNWNNELKYLQKINDEDKKEPT